MSSPWVALSKAAGYSTPATTDVGGVLCRKTDGAPSCTCRSAGGMDKFRQIQDDASTSLHKGEDR